MGLRDAAVTTRESAGGSSRVADGLLELAEEDIALGRAQPVHEEDTVQVVQLVLEDSGQQILTLDLDGSSGAIQPPQQDPAGA